MMQQLRTDGVVIPWEPYQNKSLFFSKKKRTSRKEMKLVREHKFVVSQGSFTSNTGESGSFWSPIIRVVFHSQLMLVLWKSRSPRAASQGNTISCPGESCAVTKTITHILSQIMWLMEGLREGSQGFGNPCRLDLKRVETVFMVSEENTDGPSYEAAEKNCFPGSMFLVQLQTEGESLDWKKCAIPRL